MNAFPRSSGEVTVAWLQRVLESRLDGASVTAFECSDIGAGVGVLGEIVRLELSYDKKTSAPVTLIGKFASSGREAREIADTFGFYESEVRFYRELASQTPLRSPECLFAEHDAETQDFALLLEDVRDAAMADQVLGCSPERAELAIRSVARMHGSFWGDARLDRLPWLHRLRDPNFLVEVPAMFRRNAPVSLERLVGRVPEWFPPVAERYAACLPAMLRALDALPRTFIHGDYRLDNMLFGAGAGAPPLTVLDWHIALNGPGIFDVGYFLAQSLDSEVRRAHERDLLAIYAEELAKHGGPQLDREPLLQSYRLVCLYCLLYPMTGGAAMDFDSPRSIELLRALATRAFRAIEDHGALALLESLACS